MSVCEYTDIYLGGYTDFICETAAQHDTEAVWRDQKGSCRCSTSVAHPHATRKLHEIDKKNRKNVIKTYCLYMRVEVNCNTLFATIAAQAKKSNNNDIEENY